MTDQELDLFDNKLTLTELTANIVAAFVSNNPTTSEELPNLIHRIHQSLNNLGNSHGYKSMPMGDLKPAVPVEDSVHPDYLICLEDGKRLKVLKRHLKTAFNMSLDTYKERWGLSADYPTVAPNYSIRRSSIAKNTGLGNTPKSPRLKAVG